MNNTMNRQWLLASRPHGEPVLDNFKLNKAEIPAITDGQVLVKNIFLSLDPYMRGRMNDAKSYADPVAIGEVMVGATVGQVINSKNKRFTEGEWVLGYFGWQDYGVSDGSDLTPLGKQPANPSYALGILGMPGFTAYMGLLDIGQPKAGETVVVAAASGPVGATVGQIAKIKGCKVIGIAGGQEKCSHVVNNLGFDACIDHKADDFAEQLAAHCDQGIDVYFENVGGKVFDAVLPLLNTGARVPVCGLISQYNATSLPQGVDRLPLLMGTILVKRIKMQGFIIFDDYGHRYHEFFQQMSEWLAQGKIQYKEHLVKGFEQAPEAFIGLLRGENFGKLVIQLDESVKG